MTAKRETNLMSLGVCWFFCYLAIFAEAHFTGLRSLLTVQIDLLPGLMVYAGLTFPLGVILLTGGVFGLLFDSLSANLLGTTSISLMTVGFGVFHYRELLLSEQFTAQWILGALASAAAPLVNLMVLIGSGEQPLAGWRFAVQLLIIATGGGLITPLWFVLFNRFDKALRYKPAGEGGFRPDRQIVHGRNW